MRVGRFHALNNGKLTRFGVRLCALTFALVLAGRSAGATPVVAGSMITLYDSFGSTTGGEFNAQIGGTSPAIDFITFCLETNEFFVPGQPLLVQSVTTAASNGGAAGPSPDPLDFRTAYLYTQFVQGTLSNFAFSSTGTSRVKSANALQYAIWYLEQELGTAYDTLVELDALNHQARLWVDEATAAGWTSFGNVRVLNLLRRDATGNYTVKAQDQLYFSVPEPATLFLGVVGLVAASRARRRMVV